jgi:hypothetical protein
MTPTLGIIAEIYQAVAVVNLNVQQSQHRKTENAGSFRAKSVADMAKIEGDQILILLA